MDSLHFKMGNYRTKLSRAGIKDVAGNSGKRSKTIPEGAASRLNIRKPRRGETFFPIIHMERLRTHWRD